MGRLTRASSGQPTRLGFSAHEVLQSGMAKPKRHRPITLGARFSDAEADVVRTRADHAGLTVSAYLRDLALGAPDVLPPRLVVDSELVRQILRVGVNLNQSARKLNAGHMVDGFGLHAALADVLHLLDQVSSRLAREGRP